MGLTGGEALIKYLVFAFNFIFVLAGIAVSTLGIVLLTFYYNLKELSSIRWICIPVMFIAIGAIILMVAFCGCCGAVTESRCLVITFGVFLVGLFVLEMCGGVAYYLLEEKVENTLEQELNKTQHLYSNIVVAESWDFIQTTFHCCGVNTYMDWGDIYLDGKLPRSCCEDLRGNATCTIDQSDHPYTRGCVGEVKHFLKENIVIIGGTGIVIGIIQMFAVILSCMLARFIRTKRKDIVEEYEFAEKERLLNMYQYS